MKHDPDSYFWCRYRHDSGSISSYSRGSLHRSCGHEAGLLALTAATAMTHCTDTMNNNF